MFSDDSDFIQSPKPKLLAVCGNIGSGKSTFIKNFLKNNPEY